MTHRKRNGRRWLPRMDGLVVFQQDQETRVQCRRITEQCIDVVYWNSHRSVEAIRSCSMYNVHIGKIVVVASEIIFPLTVSAYQPN